MRVLSAIAIVLLTSSATAQTRRFAVISSHHIGGPAAETLRYAARDARKMAEVLVELGGFAAEDVRLLVEPDSAAVMAALDDVEARLAVARDAGLRTMLLFYYSGHAASGELELGDSRLPVVAVRDALAASAADIRLGFVDACQSGAITRLKGGRSAPGFVVDVEPSRESRGHVIITSSTEDEASQESEDLRGSFFTHYLVSGLRGAADRSGDAIVTLGEAYEYAYNQTVTHTAGTRGGTQHPTYTYDLRGNGTVVLTRLEGLAGLVFPAGAEGRYLVYDAGRDLVVGEVDKAVGERRRLAVPPGRYVIKKRAANHVLLGEVELETRSEVEIDDRGFAAVAFEEDITKGPSWLRGHRSRRTRLEFAARVGYHTFFDGAARDDLFHPTAVVGVRAEATNFVGPGISAHIDGAFGQSNDVLRVGPYGDEAGLPVAFTLATGGVGLTWGKWVGDARMRVGPRISGVYMRRDFVDDAAPFQDLFTVAPGLEAGLAWWFGDVVIGLDAQAHYLRYVTEVENQSLGFGEIYVSVGYVP